MCKKKDAPMIVHNLLSLRHLHPAAAIAIKEIIEENPERSFVSFAPDSDWERLEKLEQVKKSVKRLIACESGDGLGPYSYNNLYHLVLNPVQKKVFNEIYGIAKEKIFEIDQCKYPILLLYFYYQKTIFRR